MTRQTVAIDLDATLSQYYRWRGVERIGPTIGVSLPVAGVRPRRLVYVGLTWRPFACPAELCRRRFRTWVRAKRHERERHPQVVARRTSRLVRLAQQGFTDREVATALGLTRREILTIRQRHHVLRTTAWGSQALAVRNVERAEPRVRDECSLILHLVRGEPGIRSSHLYQRFTHSLARLGRPRLGYTSYWKRLFRLVLDGRLAARRVRANRTHFGGWTTTWRLLP